jgi:hypothetical protein
MSGVWTGVMAWQSQPAQGGRYQHEKRHYDEARGSCDEAWWEKGRDYVRSGRNEARGGRDEARGGRDEARGGRDETDGLWVMTRQIDCERRRDRGTKRHKKAAAG